MPPTNLLTLLKYSHSWLEFWRGSEAHTQWRRSSERIRARRQQKRNTSRFSSAADQDSDWAAPRAAHSTHPQRVPWNCHCGARDESAGGLGGSSLGMLEPATTPAPPLWTLPNRMKGRHDRKIPQRGQHRRIGTSACYAVPYLRNTRICTTATIRPEVRPCSGCPVPTLNLTSIGRRSLNCLHLAHGSGRIGDCEEAVDDTHWRGNVLSQEREPLRRRRQLGKADSCRDEACF